MTEQEVERALKWYCLDCSCNDHCKDHKCAFYTFFKQYLEGNDKCIPLKEYWSSRSEFSRFHFQLINNLEYYVSNYEKENRQFASQPFWLSYVDGMKKMIEKIKEEVNYLSEEE